MLALNFRSYPRYPSTTRLEDGSLIILGGDRLVSFSTTEEREKVFIVCLSSLRVDLIMHGIKIIQLLSTSIGFLPNPPAPLNLLQADSGPQSQAGKRFTRNSFTRRSSEGFAFPSSDSSLTFVSSTNLFPVTFALPSGEIFVAANEMAMLYNWKTNTETRLPGSPNGVKASAKILNF